MSQFRGMIDRGASDLCLLCIRPLIPARSLPHFDHLRVPEQARLSCLNEKDQTGRSHVEFESAYPFHGSVLGSRIVFSWVDAVRWSTPAIWGDDSNFSCLEACFRVRVSMAWSKEAAVANVWKRGRVATR